MSSENIWKTLSAVDCNDKTEKKGNLTYLSWAWAWGIVQDHFSDSAYHFRQFDHPSGLTTDAMYYPDGTASVHVTVTINGIDRTMWLPVMDYKNKAIDSPSSRDISDAKMRCLTKCLAMFGLGHYIYAGEDIPSESSGNSVAPKAKVSKANGSSEKPNGKIKDHGVFIAHDTVIQSIKRKEDLQAHFKSNKEELAKLKESHPDVAEAIVASFKERLATLNK
tara:strand:- start:13007 stop:13669 length:663 start_codon:yes stop_codon:yes gene_type:complete